MDKDKSLLVGGLIASLAASACCLGPIILVTLGISSAGIVNSSETFRPLFIMVAISFLMAAFYLTYWKKLPDECETQCSNLKTHKRKKLALWISTFLILVSITFPELSAIATKSQKLESMGDFVEKSFYVKGMTCAGCIVSVEKALLQEKSRIQDYQVGIGQMVVRFNTDRYEGMKTDCLVAKAVEVQTPYLVYLDNNYQSRVCE